MDDDSDDENNKEHSIGSTTEHENVKDKNILRKYRVWITFLPVIFVLPFDRLMAFCIFIMLLEKTVLSILSFPGLEFTTTATFLFGYEYGLAEGVMLTLLIPNILLKLLKFWLWKEYVNPDEWPINIGITTVIDTVVCIFGYAASTIQIAYFLPVFVVALFTKAVLNIMRTRNSDVPEYMHSAVSVIVNLNLMILIYKFMFHFIL